MRNRKKKKKKKKKKKTHTHTHTPKKTITRTRQYLRGSAICLHPRSYRDFTIIRGKRKYKVQKATPVFLLILKTQPRQNPNNQIALGLGPIHLHGLSLSKSPIKKPRNIIWVGSGRVVKPDQTKLGSTKPNSIWLLQPLNNLFRLLQPLNS